MRFDVVLQDACAVAVAIHVPEDRLRKDGGTLATLLDNLSPSVCDVRHQTEVNLRHFRTGQN